MKNFIIIASILSFLAKDIASFSWQTWFYWNQNEIALEKCENKAIPMLNCNGKCYLSKQLKKITQKEENHSSKSNPFVDLQKVEIAQNLYTIEFPKHFKNTSKENNFGYKEFFSRKIPHSIFHPPIV